MLGVALQCPVVSLLHHAIYLGPVPASLGNIQSLRDLKLSGNTLDGEKLSYFSFAVFLSLESRCVYAAWVHAIFKIFLVCEWMLVCSFSVSLVRLVPSARYQRHCSNQKTKFGHMKYEPHVSSFTSLLFNFLFTGPIPTSLARATSLTRLDLASNSLNGNRLDQVFDLFSSVRSKHSLIFCGTAGQSLY